MKILINKKTNKIKTKKRRKPKTLNTKSLKPLQGLQRLKKAFIFMELTL